MKKILSKFVVVVGFPVAFMAVFLDRAADFFRWLSRKYDYFVLHPVQEKLREYGLMKDQL